MDKFNEVFGHLIFNEKSSLLSIVTLSRGIGDCGVYRVFSFKEPGFLHKLVEKRKFKENAAKTYLLKGYRNHWFPMGVWIQEHIVSKVFAFSRTASFADVKRYQLPLTAVELFVIGYFPLVKATSAQSFALVDITGFAGSRAFEGKNVGHMQ